VGGAGRRSGRLVSATEQAVEELRRLHFRIPIGYICIQ
jgi:hypothetical protein